MVAEIRFFSFAFTHGPFGRARLSVRDCVRLLRLDGSRPVATTAGTTGCLCAHVDARQKIPGRRTTSTLFPWDAAPHQSLGGTHGSCAVRKFGFRTTLTLFGGLPTTYAAGRRSQQRAYEQIR